MLAREDIDWTGNNGRGSWDGLRGGCSSRSEYVLSEGLTVGVVCQDCCDWKFGDFKNASGKRAVWCRGRAF